MKSNVIAAFVLAAAISVSLSGCATSVDDAGPHAESARQALANASTDFEREVFADLEVTREEYEEAVNRFVRCVEDSGAAVTPVDQGGYYIFQVGEDSAAYDRVADECFAGTRALIEPFYLDVITNPQAENYEQVIADCFMRHSGVVGQITGEDVSRYLDASTDGRPLPLQIEPDIFDLCMKNPQS